ncbi:MAG: DUF4145 domain-containing protein [Methylovulum sp.]|nr:DUF4145 domain-containing protein [Methylovulum sp.]
MPPALICRDYQELREKSLIDDRLFEWGEALRMHRNIGAHATSTKISKDDARDLLNFTQAICEYIFVLTEKFNKFKERTASPNLSSSEEPLNVNSND